MFGFNKIYPSVLHGLDSLNEITNAGCLSIYHVFLNSVFHCTWLLQMLVAVLIGGCVSASELHLDFQVLKKKKDLNPLKLNLWTCRCLLGLGLGLELGLGLGIH